MFFDMFYRHKEEVEIKAVEEEMCGTFKPGFVFFKQHEYGCKYQTK
jgi:hypothetical protein